MEKVFQIHLAGLLFTIEEHAYQELKSYLDRLHAHFSNNSEVVQDIESRMAELFVHKLGSNRNTLFLQDVKDVTSTLGNIDQMDEHGEIHSENSAKIPPAMPAHRKLRRSPTDQSLGGVCSGLASFFDVDPVLIRVLFVVMLIAYGGGILLYLILWVVIPEAKGDEAVFMKMQQQNKTKKLFRDGENRVIGGVSAGLSGYFGIDRVWIRVIFLVSIFIFGTGFWVYIVLWIIVPKAVTASDKLMMKGETVDIKNIEKQLLQNQEPNKLNSIAQHGTRLMGIIIRGFLKLFGALLVLILFCSVVAISAAMLAVFLNLKETQFLNELIQFTVKDEMIILAAKVGVLLSLLIPAIGLLLIGIKALFKVKFINRIWALSLGGLFLLGVLCLAYSGITFGNSVKHTESVSKTKRIFVQDTLILESVEMPSIEEKETENEVEITFYDKGLVSGKDQFYLEVDKLKLKQAKTDSIVLKISSRANGRNKNDAKEKLNMILYNPEFIGNKLVIPSYFSINKTDQFSWQEVDITLWIPEGKVIQLDMGIREFLDENNLDEADGEYYRFEKGVLKCLDCIAEEDMEETEEDLNADFNVHMNADEDNVDMEIKISNDGNGNETSTKKVIRKDGKIITIEESKSGKMVVKKRTETQTH